MFVDTLVYCIYIVDSCKWGEIGGNFNFAELDNSPCHTDGYEPDDFFVFTINYYKRKLSSSCRVSGVLEHHVGDPGLKPGGFKKKSAHYLKMFRVSHSSWERMKSFLGVFYLNLRLVESFFFFFLKSKSSKKLTNKTCSIISF